MFHCLLFYPCSWHMTGRQLRRRRRRILNCGWSFFYRGVGLLWCHHVVLMLTAVDNSVVVVASPVASDDAFALNSQVEEQHNPADNKNKLCCGRENERTFCLCMSWMSDRETIKALVDSTNFVIWLWLPIGRLRSSSRVRLQKVLQSACEVI